MSGTDGGSDIISYNTAGILSLIGGSLTLVHKLLKCEEHHTEIKRLMKEYDSLYYEFSGDYDKHQQN